ncbi:MAG TPA: GIY-YIG nuclease family protein [Xanthobacteraceae bacterium]|nr:GIY-YIG nuclease family protein [Xanthobacteraceae bacterium]
MRRVAQHKQGAIKGHTKRYNINKLAYFEPYADVRDAIQREKNMKHWPRVYKTRLIFQMNPSWRDLYDEML